MLPAGTDRPGASATFGPPSLVTFTPPGMAVAASTSAFAWYEPVPGTGAGADDREAAVEVHARLDVAQADDRDAALLGGHLGVARES